MRRKKHGMGDSCLKMKCKKDPHIRVNMCWEVKNTKKCVTLGKNDAFATRDWVEEQGGVVFWFQALPD
jgi:hypothetical protein